MMHSFSTSTRWNLSGSSRDRLLGLRASWRPARPCRSDPNVSAFHRRRSRLAHSSAPMWSYSPDQSHRAPIRPPSANPCQNASPMRRVPGPQVVGYVRCQTLQIARNRLESVASFACLHHGLVDARVCGGAPRFVRHSTTLSGQSRDGNVCKQCVSYMLSRCQR